MTVTRRSFLVGSSRAAAGLAAGALASPVLAKTLPADPALPGVFRNNAFPFQHGVASGDPLTDRVILWTRITPPADAELYSIPYSWRICADPQLRSVINQGTGYTDNSRDFTVKIDATGLRPGQTYYYVFEALEQMSDVGRTRTLPEGQVDRLRIAFTSCSNYARGCFNVYAELAKRTDLDAVLHLGDYIYEYADIESSLSTGRVNIPAAETITLDDYRQRHALYKTDKDLQQAHRQHAFMVIWDDHEVANNAWPGGADNHTEGEEGRWDDRLRGAVQAYMEWMPIREHDRGIYRNFRFGDLLDLNLMDTRLAGRDAQADTMEDRNREERTLLGYEQEAWLEEKLTAAQQENVRWKIMGQQVMVGQLGTNQRPFNYDQWDGYPAARQRLFDSVRRAEVENFVVLTGDIHSSWAMTLHEDPFADDPGAALGVELVTPAVTSPGIENQTQASLAATSLESLLPHLNFVDFYYRGYVLLDITHERMQAEWWVVDNILSHRYVSECLRALVIPAGESTLQAASAISQPRQAALAAPDFPRSLAWMRHWRRDAQVSLLDGMLADRSLVK
ncbi:MAG: alkaline phosphatase [Oceanospirillaceae bacterium]|uniref:alkaline phosphatase D family protein n=1 Tax=unclassified Thalassolituus TaxID=2624967 RepID=UPI000C6003B0|nr:MULTISPECIES: alkaline phosphatase D family protein [unclassified Thalassolituus]MAS26314.1 alkaline phosphatase [Oceanospirillaceae bacterium]MBL34913.1 alkaline phosphatase [Oceanospirillaceae bacterium]MBS51928.1 alkaline phosphatase [Oceanospirillaceae bacterium]|tara:strand:+ start:1838 stop:3529 length:1692 start_codon:yes stop_codon:yes gene_type:complete